jgi:hypothetical protein
MGAAELLEITVIEPSSRSNVTEKNTSIAINAKKKCLGVVFGQCTMSFLQVDVINMTTPEVLFNSAL